MSRLRLLVVVWGLIACLLIGSGRALFLRQPRLFLPFVAGLIFGLGLILSGMTDPPRILAFLDITRQWKPAMAATMAGGVAVTFLAFALVRRRGRALDGTPVNLPDRHWITLRLILGSTIFGVGWGLAAVSVPDQRWSWPSAASAQL